MPIINKYIGIKRTHTLWPKRGIVVSLSPFFIWFILGQNVADDIIVKSLLKKNFLNYSYDLVKVEMKLYWPTKRQKKALTHYKHPVRSFVGWSFGLLVGQNRIVDESMIFDSLSKPNDYTFQLIYSPHFFSLSFRTYKLIDFYFRFCKWILPFYDILITYPQWLNDFGRLFLQFKWIFYRRKKCKRTVGKIQANICACVPFPFPFILFDYFSYYKLILLKIWERTKILKEKNWPQTIYCRLGKKLGLS